MAFDWLDSMTNAEKASVIIAVFALIVSLIAPFVTYRWFQNDVRVQQLKAGALRVLQKGASSVSATKRTQSNTIIVINDGDLPVGDVELILAHDDPTFFESATARADPPLKFQSSVSGGSLTISFEKPLVPKQKVTLHLFRSTTGDVLKDDFEEKIKVRAWIRSEALPTTPVLL